MKLTTIKNETGASALADRVYTNLTPGSRKVAEAALIKANPQLADPAGFKGGAVVTVPDIPDVKHRLGTGGHDPFAAVIAGLRASLEAYGRELAENLNEAAADIKNQTKLLEQKDVADAIKRDSNSTKMRESLTASLRDRAKQIDKTEKQLTGLLKQIVSDLGSLG